jgi:nicotinate-nucleotide pyrophosphorylase (carboxylating)
MNCVKKSQLKKLIKQALREDIGKKDITTRMIIPKNKLVKAILLAKQDGIICGLEISALVFKAMDKKIKFKPLVKEGQKIRCGKVIARLRGKAQSILTAERVALNFLSLLSGIATKTRAFVDKVKPYRVKIMDTRKTIPGLRILEKYAVRVGGGFNHRFRLDEMVLIKDNHLKVTQGYLNLPKFTKNYPFEIEVKNLKEFKQALKLKPAVIMLDNLSPKQIQKAVQIRNNAAKKAFPYRPKLEASGGINLENIRKIAATGVEMISIGDLTHSVNSVDISLEI